jgi:uncharacterized protein YjbI with pentapeptide repeats
MDLQEKLERHKRWLDTAGIEGKQLTCKLIREELEQHKIWLDSRGKDGVQFDVSNSDLSRANLSGKFKLRKAKFNSTILKTAYFSVDMDLARADFENADLTGAYLGGIHLDNATFVRAKLTNANLALTALRGANFNTSDLNGADLSSADLSGARLTKASLVNTNLSVVKARNTDFTGANLTNACIYDWHINPDTKFDKVVCQSIYLKFTIAKGRYVYLDRRPHNENEFFKPGEFEALVRQYADTVDLIFREGIDWQALSISLDKFRVENGGVGLAVQSIENKGGDFVIKVAVPPGSNVDKGAIETRIKQGYEQEIKAIEARYEERLQLKGEQAEFFKEQLSIERLRNTDLTRIIDKMSGSKYDMRGANIGNMADIVQDQAGQQANQDNTDR